MVARGTGVFRLHRERRGQRGGGGLHLFFRAEVKLSNRVRLQFFQGTLLLFIFTPAPEPWFYPPMAYPASKQGLPPMMVRYLEYKERYPDALLFFQVGDFYELFYDDAVVVAKSLNLTLTSRDKNSPNPVPMCGVPIAVIDGYVDRLLPLGFSVAVVSQTGSGAGVDRALERFVTPGMRLFNSVSSDSGESLIAALGVDADGRGAALAWTDPQTGTVRVREALDLSAVSRELSNLMVREVVLPRQAAGEKVDRRTGWVRTIESAVQAAAVRFRSDVPATTELEKELPTDASAELHAMGVSAKRAVRMLFSYIDEISLGNPVPIRELSLFRSAGAVIIDAATRRNLELVQNTKDGSSAGTLFGFLNRTVTPGGARLMRSWVLAPLLELPAIKARQEAITSIMPECRAIARVLEGLSDLERLAARVQLAVASPKDLVAIRETLERLPHLQSVVSVAAGSLLTEAAQAISAPDGLGDLLSRALVENPPHVLHDGGVIRDGFDPELDEIRGVRATADTWRAEFETQEKLASGIASLKVKSNNVIGFFIEVPTSQAGKVPAHYTRRQSTANAERYTTPELKKHEDAVINAVGRQVKREQELFAELRTQLSSSVDDLRRIAGGLALVDTLASLALVAESNAWIEPELAEEPVLMIERGRHPIIAALLEGAFVPNSVDFVAGGPSCFLVTGPNMGGKSTYLRQTALIALLGQIGSRVPADRARIGLVDRVFARLGAADDLHEGESTFMVEMREASHILAHATPRSLVLIDELGRGTATSDGLSLAQAILEQLLFAVGCRTLFATHYHELTALESATGKVANLSVGSVERDDQVIFTHEIQRGPAPRSYGLEVAKLSGLPERVIQRAQEVLSGLPTAGSRPLAVRRQPEQRDLFAPRAAEPDPVAVKLKERIETLEIDDLSARQALDVLYELKALGVKRAPLTVRG